MSEQKLDMRQETWSKQFRYQTHKLLRNDMNQQKTRNSKEENPLIVSKEAKAYHSKAQALTVGELICSCSKRLRKPAFALKNRKHLFPKGGTKSKAKNDQESPEK